LKFHLSALLSNVDLCQELDSKDVNSSKTITLTTTQ